MIPKLHDSKGTVIGDLTDCLKGITIEERNGMLEAEITYQLFSPHWDKLIRGNIFTADVNDKIKNQKFRIYKVGKNILGRFTVYARHISYDVQRDMIDGLDIQNQSCEYCLNMIFRNSQFSQNFRGHSDIVNAQNFKIGPTHLLSAIGGTRGSILDTFGTGAEIKRDNYDFYVLNKRGHDNDVTIEYAKNLTGLDYTEDEEGLITRIKAIAKYKLDSGEETEIFTYVDSPKILDYETPFVKSIDFSDKFEDGETPTTEKLERLGEKYFNDNKCDFVKFNYKISFIPLSKCAGYSNIEDKIELCDTVRIKDYRYNLDTKAKVIKATYDFLRERYESMELGEPRTSLGDIIGNGNIEESKPGPPGPPGPPGADGNIGDFPDSLPSTPVLTAKVYGFATIELSWTYENKVYYNYEIYASKTKDFTPNVFDLIHQGQTSSFLFQAKPNETWYFRCCAINSHSNRTDFSAQVTVTTTKVDDMSNYFEEAAIGNAVVGSLTADYMKAGIIKGNWIDAKNLTVTNGNGKRTLDIDSFGNVNLDVTTLNINSESVATNKKVDEGLKRAESNSKDYTNSQVKVLNNEISLKVNKNEFNSLIQQNSESVKIAFNGISSEWKFDLNKFTNTVNGKTGLSLGSGRLNVNRFTDGKPVGFYGQSFSGNQQYWGNVIAGTYNSYYTAIGFNPNVVNDGDSTASGFEHFMTYVFYPFGSAYPNPGIYVQKPMYIHSHLNVNAPVTLHQNISLNNNNEIILGSTSNALYQVAANIYTSSNRDLKIAPGVTTQGGLIVSGNGYFHPENEGGYSLGTTQKPFYKLYSTTTYSNSNIVYNTSVKTKATTNNEDVLDNIEFISSYEKTNNLVMDITKIANTNYVEVDEENNAYMNDSEMIKLLIKEVKNLKEEIKFLKSKG